MRTLPQQQMAIPQDIGLKITNTVIAQANITTLDQTNAAITQIDKELEQLDKLENALPTIRKRYQDNINVLNKLLPLQKLQEDLEKLDKLSEETKRLESIYKQKLADFEELKKSILNKIILFN